MTDDELDVWIVAKTDTHALMEKMNDVYRPGGVGKIFYVRLLEEQGMPFEDAYERVRLSLMRLLRAGLIQAVGINGWSTNERAQATTDRQRDAAAFLNGEVPHPYDLVPL
jgi:hypothetical protein